MRQLPVHLVHKVWGRQTPPAPFSNPGPEPLGEIWFDPPPELANLLVKFIFTDAKLSVQVHPDDSQAPAGQRGKDECWYILDAEPGAQIALGLEREIGVEELREAARDGSIEQMLGFREVSRGEFIAIPAGTIHAIGPGISLLEVQQNSDITYRLYDYGRPRELHLEDALRVAKRGPAGSVPNGRPSPKGFAELIDGPFFRVARIDHGGTVPDGRFSRDVLVLPLSKGVTLGGQPLDCGSCTLATGTGELALSTEASAILVEDTSAASA